MVNVYACAIIIYARAFITQTLIVDLTRSLDEPQDSANLQIAVLSFFNAVINYRAGQVRQIPYDKRLSLVTTDRACFPQESLEFRMHLRHELLLLGILPITDRLRALNISHLNRYMRLLQALVGVK